MPKPKKQSSPKLSLLAEELQAGTRDATWKDAMRLAGRVPDGYETKRSRSGKKKGRGST